MYQLNNVPNNIIELSHSKLSDNAVLSIARRIAMFKNNDALEPTHHICSLIAEASVRLTAVTDVTTAVSSIRIQLTLHVLNTRMILGLSVLLPDTNTISYVLSSNRAVWAITSHAFNASIVFVTSRTCRVFKKISTNPTIWLITVSNVANSIPIIAITKIDACFTRLVEVSWAPIFEILFRASTINHPTYTWCISFKKSILRSEVRILLWPP